MVIRKQFSNDAIETGHNQYLPLTLDHSAMIIGLVVSFSITYIYQYFFGNPDKLKDDQFVDEDAEKYYQTLPGIIQKRLYARECYHEAEFGNKTMSEDACEQLRTSQ